MRLSQLGEAILRGMRSVSPKLEALGAMLLMPFIITVRYMCCTGFGCSNIKLQVIWFWVVDNLLMAAENIEVSDVGDST